VSSETTTHSRVSHELRSLLTAVQYFTRVPVPAWVGHTPMQLHNAARYFPLIGIGVGLVAAAALWVTSLLLPMTLAVVVSTVVTVCLTGAFHEDGLADTVDGLGGAFTRQRALEIMKDSRVGTFGALALLFAVLLKIGALAAMPVWEAMVALVAGHGVSRACAVAIAWQLPYARNDDSTRAKPVVEGLRARDAVTAIVIGAAPLVLVGVRALQAVFAASLTTILLLRWFKRRLGGYTGDTLGATQQICEVVLYLALISQWNSY
jgi:adenosylcobinamide-GDP ribazoletransferase